MTEVPEFSWQVATSLVTEGTVVACVISGLLLGWFFWHTGSQRIVGLVFLRTLIAGWTFCSAIGMTRLLEGSIRWESTFGLAFLWAVMASCSALSVYLIGRYFGEFHGR